MRRIHFKPTLLSITVLNKLVSQCPFLDEIVFGGRDFSLSPEIWIILSTHCPILRVLRLQGYVFVPPEVPELILLFPRLEELEFTFAMFNKDPDIFNTLGDAFMEHKERHGSVHPLKVLYTSGKIMHPVRVLADLLALAVPTKIESLTVGGTNVPCNVSRVEMNDRNQLQKLYACFGDPSLHLRSLTVNINQLRNLISNDLYVLRLNNTNIPRGRDIKANLQVYRKMASEHCGFWFATVEKLTIRAQLQWFETAGDRGMNLFEARLVMAASPKL
ncbi:hypothetical protein BGW39_010914 [Mortierella sp. 14UC]|nr:hypothetical protein BGW39_010914 [Mortierella sp. 14UC]